MNILDFLKEKTNSYYHLKYYGPNDLSTGIIITEFINDNKIILEYAKTINYVVNSIDTLIDYAFFDVAIKYEEAISIMKPEFLEQFKTALDDLRTIYSKFNKGEAIKYLIQNYKDVIDYDEKDDDKKLHIEYELREYVFDFLTNHLNNDIKNSGYFEYLLSKDICFAFDNVDVIMKVDEKYLSIFFEEENLKELFRYNRLSDIMQTIINVKNNNEEYKKHKSLIDNTINYLYTYTWNRIKDESNHIYERYDLYHKLSVFLEKISDGRLNGLKKLETNLANKINEEIKKTGKTVEYYTNF